MRRNFFKKLSILLSATLVALFALPSETAYSKTITREKYMNDDTIETLVIGDDVTSIGDRAYYGCKNLKSVTIPEGVKSIGESAFAMCPNLSYVSIPSTVKKIEPGVFAGDVSLSDLAFPRGNSHFYFLAGALYNEKGTKLISYLPGKSYHFYDMPDSIKEIDKYAFWGSKNLEKVYVSPNVPSITPYDFAYCSGLKYIYLPESVESIQEYAFRDCINLKSIYSEKKDIAIDPTAFKRAGKAETVSGANLETFNSKCVIENEEAESQSMIAEAVAHQDNNMAPASGSAPVSAASSGMTPEEWGRYVARNSHFTSNNYKARLAVTDSIDPVTDNTTSSQGNTPADSSSTGTGGSNTTSSTGTVGSNSASRAQGSNTASSTSSTGTGGSSSASSTSSTGTGGSSSASSTSTGGGNSASSTGTGGSNSQGSKGSDSKPSNQETEVPGPVTIINENYYF